MEGVCVAACVRGMRSTVRRSLFVSALGLLVFLSIAQGASASTKLIGEEISNAHSQFIDPEETEAYKFTASSTGTVETLEMLTNEAENTGVTSVTFGIYDNNGGNPGPILGEGTYTGTPPTNSWFGVSGLSIPLVTGKSYWIAIHDLGGYLFFNVGNPEGERWVHWTSPGTTLPAFSEATWGFTASTDKPAFRGLEQGSTGGTGVSGTTGPTGPTGEKGEKGEKGVTGPAGEGGGSGGTATVIGHLKKGTEEFGGWTVTIKADTGDLQMQANGVASFPIPTEETAKVKYNYRNGKEALEAKPPCLGNTNEPAAEEGNLCFYRGINGAGSLETEDKGVNDGKHGSAAGEVFFQDFQGNVVTYQKEESGQLGVDVIFRTNQFNATGEGEPATLSENAYMVAQGSWAVTPG